MDPTTRPWHGPRKELGRLHEETALAADAQRRIEAVSVDVAGRRVAIARLDDTIMLVSGDAGALVLDELATAIVDQRGRGARPAQADLLAQLHAVLRHAVEGPQQ